MGYARRRVSYVIPPATDPVSSLKLPAEGTSRLGVFGPQLIYHESSAQEKRAKLQRQPRHRLGVSSLALDTSTHLAGRSSPEGILYSGGRDGLILSWDLGISMKKKGLGMMNSASEARGRWEMMTGWSDREIDQEHEEGEKFTTDGDILGDVPFHGRRRRKLAIPYEQQWEIDFRMVESGKYAEFRQSTQANVDWINDIALCNLNQTVISASSDGTIKSWSPHLADLPDPSTLGQHSDYVRCLAPCREFNWIASGSFDHTIKLWDLTRTEQQNALVTLSPPDSNAAKASIYALASDLSGTMIASGSPERVIRLWDPRIGRRIGKLVGHTDNIRSILISEDSKYLLTGSADASIKLWSLASQRCLHTFTHHMESVWSLHSTHPSLEVFYSGDRSGLVCRVDIENCTDISEGECILLFRDTNPSKPTTDGINKIVVLDDNLVWTASGCSDIKRWSLPHRRSVRVAASTVSPDCDHLRRCDSPSRKSQGASAHNLSQDIDAHLLSARDCNLEYTEQLTANIADADPRLYSIPLNSLIRLVSPRDCFTPRASAWRGHDAEVATLYSAASIKSIPQVHLVLPAMSQRLHTSASKTTSPLSEECLCPANLNSAGTNYEEREVARDAVPFRAEPDEVIHGEHGLVRAIILNNRIHALTADTSGEVAVWDIVRAVCLGRFSHKEVIAACKAVNVEETPREMLEKVRERIEGEAVVSPWVSADTKAGILRIHLNEKSFEAEVYADDVGYQNDKRFNDDSKINLGKWVLQNLFSEFIREERRARREQYDGSPIESPIVPPSPTQRSSRPDKYLSSPLRKNSTDSDQELLITHPRTSVCQSAKMLPTLPPSVQLPVHSSPLFSSTIPLQLNRSCELAVSHKRLRSSTLDGVGEIAVGSQPAPSAWPPVTNESSIFSGNSSGGIIERLRQFGRSEKRPTNEVAASASTISSAESTTTTMENTGTLRRTEAERLLSGLFTPAPSSEFPSYSPPSNMILLISEEESPSYRIVFRGTVGSVKYDVKDLEKTMPLWLLEYLLLNKLSTSPSPSKMSFFLLPSTTTNPTDRLPFLVQSPDSKLTAPQHFRVKKLLQYVQENLDNVPLPSTNSRTSSRSSQVQQSKAEDVYEIVCNNVLLPIGMTLVTVKYYVWRQSTDMTMYYRRKVT